MLTDKAAASDSHQNAPIPLQILQEKIGIVKKSAYHQMAGEYALILKVSAGLAVKVALTCRTTFC